jgi:hypothetical protein
LEFATECLTNAIGDEDNMKVQIDQIGEEEKRAHISMFPRDGDRRAFGGTAQNFQPRI